jgi:hypothetical protein
MTDENTTDVDANTEDTTEDTEDTFPRHVVTDLRKEAAGYREKARTAETRADELSRALFTARVAATGKLADPSDLEYDPDIVDDPDAISAAADQLLADKPHLGSRTPRGDIGQGSRGKQSAPVDFSALFR